MLINISRGAVVDEDALTAALSEKKLYGAVLDVLKVNRCRRTVLYGIWKMSL